jgi:hypothetical protein
MKTMCVRALVAVAVGCGGAALGQTCSSPTTLTVTGTYSINGQLRPVLKFREGVNYTFNASAVSGFHPLILTLSPTGGGGAVPLNSSQLFGYNGTPICSTCSQTSVTVRPTADTPSEFYYQCNVHMGLGAKIVMVRTPLVVLGPASQSVEPGEHAMFGVGVESNGSDVVLYQWYRNAAPIAGATDAVYMIDSVSEADEGAYFCLLTNECGDTTASPIATLSVSDVACDSLDFNGDSSFFDPTDIDAFLSVFSEGPCVPASAMCGDVDFNNDGSLFDPCDVDAFLLVFSEGPCTLCGV